MKKYIIATLFLFALPVSAYYNPGTPTGFVNDYANIIDDEREQALEEKLVQFKKDSGNEIAVAIINNLDGDYIENFAEKLFAEWGIGKAKEDNGVLVLVALEERELRIEVGYGLEGALTDAQSYLINKELTAAFKEERYADGMNSAVDKIIAATQGEYMPSDDSGNEGGGWDYEFIIWLVVFGLMWLSAILGRSKSWWAGGIIGGIVGIVLGFIWGWLWIGVSSMVGLTIFGLIFDYFVSKSYSKAKSAGKNYPWWIGGGKGGGGFGGGGFGGFGGGMSGGGGSSGSW